MTNDFTMSEPSLNYVLCPDACDGHRMAYWQWGNPQSSHVVLCVHGLSRQGRDFDVLARALCAKAGDNLRVICPDVIGRGQSDWLKDPMGYQIGAYAADMRVLLAQLNPATLDWIGTSMGGLIGLVVCGQPEQPVPLRRLVLNDVGPRVQWQALQRIGEYLGQSGQFSSLQQASDAMWKTARSFGPHTPAQWLDLIRGHWGGVEVRNHWRRDAVQGEDGTRSRKATLLANVALIRNALLAVMAEALESQSLPELRERLHSHPARALALLEIA